MGHNLIHRRSFELSAFDHAKVLTAISSFVIENDADIDFAIDKPVTKGPPDVILTSISMNVIDTGTYASIVNMKFKKNVTSSRDTFSELLYFFGAGDAVRNIDTTSTILNVHDLIKYKKYDDNHSSGAYKTCELDYYKWTDEKSSSSFRQAGLRSTVT
ncbi:hypothetical protein ACO0R3_002359 [Hanseniaspora guilliermondii]